MAADDTVRAIVELRRFNLSTDRYPFDGELDLIFCRNVLIYFDQPTKVDVLERLARLTEPGGFLVLGAAETVVGLTDAFKPLAERRGLYLPNAAANATAPGFSALKAAAVAAMR